MRIISVTIHAFGKLHDKTMHFDEGLNLIYGLNEQGKSTVHKFIEVMFYGFFKPYTKNRQYEDGYASYLPWHHEGYGGTLTFEDDGRAIRLERQLTKGKENLSIFDADTGEEITDSYEYNKVIRQVDPGLRHFKHNKITYRNTVSMTQMESKTDETMVTEIKDHMSNLASTHQVNISVDKVLEKIHKKEDNIGSDKKRTSPYAKLKVSIDELKRELTVAKDLRREINQEKVHEMQLIHQVEALDDEMVELKEDLQYMDALKNKGRINKVEKLIAEEEEVLQIINANEIYKDFSVEEADQLKELSGKISSLKQQLSSIEDKSRYLKESIEQFQTQSKDIEVEGYSDYEFERLQKAVFKYDETSAVLRMKETEQNMFINQKKLVEKVDEPAGFVFPLLIMTVLLAGVLYGALKVSPYFWMGAMTIAAIMANIFAKYHNQKDIYKKYKLKIEQLDDAIEGLDEEKDALMIELKDILNEEQVYDDYTLHAKRDKMLSSRSVAEAKAQDAETTKSMYMKVQEASTDTKEQHQKLTAELRQLAARMENKLATWQLKSEDYVPEGLRAHMAYMNASSHHSQLVQRMEELLDGQSLEGMKEVIDMPLREVHETDEEKMKLEIERLQEKKSTLSEEISASLTRQTALLDRTRTIVEIEEDIHGKEEKLAEYDHELAVLALMKNTIGAIALEIQNNFAPSLNAFMSSVIMDITEGKYSDIKVNPEMQLTIYDEKAHRTIAAENLSAGTIDILYFGLRLGISDVLTEGKKLPLILDDAFVQYDDVRMEHVIDLLGNQRRQVLLFTCHKREMHYLNKKGSSYNKVILSLD